MKKIKRFGVFALAALMAVGTCACVGKNNVKDGRYTIGICQIVEHEALEEANKGFKDALTEKLGDKVRFDVKNVGKPSSIRYCKIDPNISSRFQPLTVSAPISSINNKSTFSK